MRHFRLVLIVITFFTAQVSFAADKDIMPQASKSCGTIAKACIDAGFTRNSEDKMFWQDCMKPLILGKTVQGVTVDADTVKSCRTDKIQELKKEMEEFENASK